MSSPLGNKQNITVFVLYLMQNVGYPMDFVTVNDIIMQSSFSVPPKDQGKISYARENGNVCVVRSFN